MKIAHLADIHVRDSRRAEYAEVIERLYAQLEASPPAAVVIAGDIFDTMTRASAANWDDVATFLQRLAALAPVVLIPGNHDLNERKRGEKVSLLAPLFKAAGGARGLDPNRVCLWDAPGIYEHPGVPGAAWVIGIPSADLPTDEDLQAALAAAPHLTAVAAVFHETISGCRYPNGQAAESERFTPTYLEKLAAAAAGRPLAVMLGDVHLRQEIKLEAPNARCAYPGSLVCQNFGEPHIGHGWLEWDLTPAAPVGLRAVEVPNPRAMYTVRVEAGQDATPEPRPETPGMWRVRADAATSSAQLAALVDELTKRHGRPPREVEHDPPPPATEEELTLAIAAKREPGAPQAKSSEEDHLAAWLAANCDDAALAAAVRAAHAAACQEHRPPTAARPHLTRLEFSNMYCYGEGNTADFAAMRAGPPGLVGLTAPNMSGKSSLLDIIYMAMTGAPMRGRKAKAMREGAAHYELYLAFELDGRPGSVAAWSKANRQELKLEYDGEELTGKSVTETAQAMRKIFGDPRHIARISLYRPGRLPDFMHLPPKDQDALIMDLLALGHHKDIKKRLDRQFTELRARVRTAQEMLEDALPGVAQAAGTTQVQRLNALVEHVNRAADAEEDLRAQGLQTRERADAAGAATAALEASRASAKQVVQQVAAYEPARWATGGAGALPVSTDELPGTLMEFGSLCGELATAGEAEPTDEPADACKKNLDEAQARLEAQTRQHELAIEAAAAATALAKMESATADDIMQPEEAAKMQAKARAARGLPLADLQARVPGLEQKARAVLRAPAAQLEQEHAAAREERDRTAAATREAELGAHAAAAPEDIRTLAREPMPPMPAGPKPEYDAATAEAALRELETAAVQARTRAEHTPYPQAEEPVVPEQVAKPARMPDAIRPLLPPLEELRAAIAVPQPAQTAADLEAAFAAQERSRAAKTIGAELEAAAVGPNCAACTDVRARIAAARAHGADQHITLADIKAAQAADAAWARRVELTALINELHIAQKYVDYVRAAEAHGKWVKAKEAHDQAAQAEAAAAAASREHEQRVREVAQWHKAVHDREVIAAADELVTRDDACRAALAEATAAQAAAQARLDQISADLAVAQAAEQAAQKLQSLRQSIEAEKAQGAMARHQLATASEAARQHKEEVLAQLQDAEKTRALYARRVAYHAAREKRDRHAHLAARLSATLLQAQQTLEETTATLERAEQEASAAAAALAALRTKWTAVAKALACKPAVARIMEDQKELEVVALHRRALDPVKGLAPLVLRTTRTVFAASINKRLAAASAPFRVVQAPKEEGFELVPVSEEGRGALPMSSDPELVSGYQAFVLELAARAALEETARVPLPAILLLDEGFGCLDGANLPDVAESLRCVAADARPGRAPPLVMAVTHRDDLRPAFAQHYTLTPPRPGAPASLTWGGDAAHLALGAEQDAARTVIAAAAAGPSGKHLGPNSRCMACDKQVSPGLANWQAHVATPGHIAWTDPGLRGGRRDEHIECALCGKTFKNGKYNWAGHVKTKAHQAALAGLAEEAMQ